MSETESLPRYITVLLPTAVRNGSPEELRSALFLVISLLVLAAANLFYLPVLWATGFADHAWMVAGSFAGLCLLLVLYRWTNAHLLVSLLLLASLTSGVVGSVILRGSQDSATMSWLVLVPVLALVLAGRGAALGWLLLIGGAEILVHITHPVEPDMPLWAAAHLVDMASRFALCFVLTCTACGYESSRKRAWWEQNRLEAKLKQAGERMGAAHATARLVLDQVGQALVLFSADGHALTQHSRAASEHFDQLAPGCTAWSLFATGNPRYAAFLEACWISAGGGWMPLDLCLAQLPREVSLGGRVFDVEWRVSHPEEPDSGVLMVATDTTEFHRARVSEETTREAATLLIRSLEEAALVRSFVDEADRLVAGVAGGEWPVADQRRALHTLKGSASLLDLTGFARWLHGLEDRLGGSASGCTGGCTPDDAAELTRRWWALRDPMLPFLQRGRVDEVVVEVAALGGLMEQARLLPGGRSLAEALASLGWEPVEPRLAHLARRGAEIRMPAGSGKLRTHVRCDGLRLPPRGPWAALWSSLVHVVRNAVDHGIESSEERIAQGKPAAGSLELSARHEGGRAVIEIRDDGRGVQWPRVAARAEAMGLPNSTRQDLVEALFTDGLSTRDRVTELSGRGVGLSAVWFSVQRLGGTVRVESEPGCGTTVRLDLPLPRPDLPGTPFPTLAHDAQGAEAC